MATSDEAEDREREALTWLAANVRHHRRRLKLTQAQLATEVGISFATIRVVERGRHSPSFRVFVGLSVALGVQLRDLLKPREMVERPKGRPRG